jgi:hypothetical protein
MKLSIQETQKRQVYKNFFDFFSLLLGAKQHNNCWYTNPQAAPFPVFNSVIQTKSSQNKVSSLIKEMQTIYQQTKQFCWWLIDYDPITGLQDSLSAAHFEKGSPFLGMVYSLESQIILPSDIANIQVHEMQSPERLSEWIKPVQDAFHMDPQSAQFCVEVFTQYWQDPRLKHYYVEKEGRIVGTGTLFIQDKVSGFYNLAVVPEYQNQKIATALKWHRLKISQELGAHSAILQSSTMGKALDMRIGFKPVLEFVPYFSPVG